MQCIAWFATELRMAEIGESPKTIISRTRFLIIEPDAAIAEGLKRFLLSEGAPKVYVAQSPLLALRTLQDRATPVDCVLCGHRPRAISGIEFLADLRAGRWGGPPLQHLKCVLLMPVRDDHAIAIAREKGVTGFVLGKLERENVRKSLVAALAPPKEALVPNFRVAHMRAGEADLIVAPFPPSFGYLSAEVQQRALQAIGEAAHRVQLSGAVAAIFATENGETVFLAPEIFHRFLSKMTAAAAEKLLNRALHVDWKDGDPTVMTARPIAPSEPEEPVDGLSAAPLILDEKYADRRRPTVETSFARGLAEEDVRRVAVAFKELGPQTFVQKFVRHQAISLRGPDQPFVPTMREFYVSIDLLRAAFFPGVEMRGSARSFQSLTHLLDQLMLRSLPFLPHSDIPTSLNLNVHSILTKTFENAIRNARADLLTFEIPQPAISTYFEEFKKAREIVAAYGGRIAVDQIFPDTIGALNLQDVSPSIAKLHWKGDLKHFSTSHRDYVKKNIDHGLTVVMSRVDDPDAFKVGREFGIQNFQGFLIDKIGEAGLAP